ncbi:hypothetical protein MNO09_04925 [Bacillus sp. N5-665]|nr:MULTISPECIES: hypothetical protein [Bacillus]MCC2378110.1 hypothetical protein [Bacillus wiedmannii]MCC2423335.1 hypothetical protein [Bacillus wiedmannii]UNK34183.1 hypothetical protein MNO09_04925 [Bacillus sp. N5-665]
MIVNSVGTLDCKTFAEVLVRITRNDILNGKIGKTEEINEVKDSSEKEE